MESLKAVVSGWGVSGSSWTEPEAPQVRAQSSRAWFRRPDVKWLAGCLGLMMARTAMAMNVVPQVVRPLGPQNGTVGDPMNLTGLEGIFGDNDTLAVRVTTAPSFLTSSLTPFRETGRVAGISGCAETHLLGEYAVTLFGSGLQIFNASSLQSVGNYHDLDGLGAGVLAGSLCFALTPREVIAVNLSDPTFPHRIGAQDIGLGFFTLQSHAITYDASQSRLWVTYSGAPISMPTGYFLRNVEASNPSNLALGSSTYPLSQVVPAQRHQVAGFDGFVLFANLDVHSAWLDSGFISGLATASSPPQDWVRALTERDRVGYSYDSVQGTLQTLDLSNVGSFSPVPVMGRTGAGWIQGGVHVMVSGPYAFVAEGATGRVQVIDCRNATVPTYYGNLSVSGPTRFTAVQGQRAVVTDTDGFTTFAINQLDLSGTPGSGDVGTHPVVIEADDGRGGVTTYQFDITISERPAVTTGSASTGSGGTSAGGTTAATTGRAPTESEAASSTGNVALDVVGAVAGGLLCLVGVGGVLYRVLARRSGASESSDELVDQSASGGNDQYGTVPVEGDSEGPADYGNTPEFLRETARGSKGRGDGRPADPSEGENDQYGSVPAAEGADLPADYGNRPDFLRETARGTGHPSASETGENDQCGTIPRDG